MQSIRALGVLLFGVLALAAPPAAADVIVNATVRDFCVPALLNCPSGYSQHPDFGGGLPTGLTTGMVTNTLGPDGRPVLNGAQAQVTSATSFGQWYHDTPGLNASASVPLLFEDLGGGLHRYENTSFFPIDNQLLFNQGMPHNHYFTTHISTTFTYQGVSNLLIHATDDMWAYVGDVLVLDTGGVHSAIGASVNLNHPFLALVSGQSYTLDIFLANRNSSESSLRIDTTGFVLDNNDEVTTGEPASAAVLAAGVLALAGRRRR